MKHKPVVKVRLKERRRRESYMVYALFVLVLVALIGVTAYVTRLPTLRVHEIHVEGTEYADRQALEALVEETLKGTYTFLVPKDMRYVIPKGEVTERLLTAFPLLESASVGTEGSALIVTVTERTPAATYCASKCYRMDAYGFVFDATHDDKALPAFSGGQLAIGSTYLNGGFHDLHATLTGLEDVMKRKIERVRVDSNDDVFATLRGGGELRFVRTASREKVQADVKSIAASSLLASGAAFEYIELRFGQKAAVKLVHE